MDVLLSFLGSANELQNINAGSGLFDMDERISGYRVGERIGEGGMAIVFKARHLRLDRDVALKVMRQELKIDTSFADRFLREAKIAARLSHPNIIQIYDVDEINQNLFLAMELVRGGDLSQRLLLSRSKEQALNIFPQLCEALDYAHCVGYLHRDVKPANLLFRKNGAVALSDFGIARLQNSQTQMTLEGAIIGTPSYMSPEQALGREITNRSDLYSVAVMMYEYVTGEKPYQASTTISTVVKHVNDPIPLLPNHLNCLQEFFNISLAKQAEHRFADGAELVREFGKGLAKIKSIRVHVRNETPGEATFEQKTKRLKGALALSGATNNSASEESSSHLNNHEISTENLLCSASQESMPSGAAADTGSIKQAKPTPAKLKFFDSSLKYFSVAAIIVLFGCCVFIVYSKSINYKAAPSMARVEALSLDIREKSDVDDIPKNKFEPSLGKPSNSAGSSKSEGNSFVLETMRNLDFLSEINIFESAYEVEAALCERQLNQAAVEYAKSIYNKALVGFKRSEVCYRGLGRDDKVHAIEIQISQVEKKHKIQAQSQTVAALSKKGNTASVQGRLYAPEKDNAWHYLSQSLALAPHDPSTRADVERLKIKIAKRAKTSTNNDEFTQAESDISFLLEIDKDFSKLPALQARLDYKKNPNSSKHRKARALYNKVAVLLKRHPVKAERVDEGYSNLQQAAPYHPLLEKLETKISTFYRKKARRELKNTNWVKAEEYIARGLIYKPNSEELKKLKDEVGAALAATPQ